MSEMIYGEVCSDNRFELIEKYKQELIRRTNISSRAEEMEVLESILFRFWQMGWLDCIEKQIPKNPFGDVATCPTCHSEYGVKRDDYGDRPDFCTECGQAMDWSDYD